MTKTGSLIHGSSEPPKSATSDILPLVAHQTPSGVVKKIRENQS